MSWYESVFWIALLIIVIVADHVRRTWFSPRVTWSDKPGLSHSLYTSSAWPPYPCSAWPHIVRVESEQIAEDIWRHDYFVSVALEPAPVDEARTQEVSQ
jgi:lipase chaperone LimK